MLETLFALAEIGIFLGGVFVASLIAPHLQVQGWRTKAALIGIFATGGAVFLLLALNTAYDPEGLTPDELTSWIMGLLIFSLLVSVWGFIIGIYSFVLRQGQDAKSGKEE